MARRLLGIQCVKEDEHWVRCQHCDSVIAYHYTEVLRDLFKVGFGIITCPECKKDITVSSYSFNSTEHK